MAVKNNFSMIVNNKHRPTRNFCF